jgi:hypothetical protein
VSSDELGKVDIGDGKEERPMYIKAELLTKFTDCFAWSYTEMPGLDKELVEHRLPFKQGFRPYK